MTQEYRAGEGVSFGRIFGRAFDAIRAQAPTIFGLAAVFAALPNALLTPFTQRYSRTFVEQDASGSAITAVSGAATSSFAILVWLVIYTIALGAIVRVTVAHADGRTLRFAEAAGAGLRVALPLIGLSILWGLAIGLASLFLLVPGIILAVTWAVAIPARAVEPIGVVASFGRSRTLTKGARWTIFGFGVVVFLIYFVFAAVLGLVAFASLGAGGIARMAEQPQAPGILSIVTGLVVTTLTTAIFTALHASLYVELRDWKDGPQATRLAEIFA